MSMIDFLCRVSDCVFGKRLSEKFRMAANVILHEWHEWPPTPQVCYEWAKELQNVSDDEIRSVFKDMDEESLDQILRYVTCKRDFVVPDHHLKYYLYSYHALLRPAEIKQIAKQEKELKKERKKYYSSNGLDFGSYESLLQHHGLKELPLKAKQYLQDGVFLDVGACYGDSALIFAKYYQPGKVISFEPSGPNREIFLENMQENGIPSSLYEIVPMGLGRECCSLRYNETPGGGNTLREEVRQEGNSVDLNITTCDLFCSERELTEIRLIKADIEGMGLDLLLGAKNVIRENRPVLSLSIYHNREELFGIYQTLKSWDLKYYFKARMLSFPRHFGELSLIAWPEDLNS